MRVMAVFVVLLVAVPALQIRAAEPALTIYNQSFAVVREMIHLDLQQGLNQVSVSDTTAHLEPDSVILRDPAGQRHLQIVEQNYRGDPVSEGLLLQQDGQLEFTGENTIKHTAKDETLKIYTGSAFDLIGERTWTNFVSILAQNFIDESFQIKLRNHKDQPVEIRVVEHMYRHITWEIREPSDPFTKTDSRAIEFRVNVPAGGEKTVTYVVHYSW